MSRNNKGFTMIELLAAVVVLGILMGSAVAVITSVLNDQRNTTYIDDAIRLASKVDYKMRSENKIKVPARGNCLLMSLRYVDDNTFNKAPYGGEYDKDRSFVVAKRNPDQNGDEYIYYVTLVEKMESGGYRGVRGVNDYETLAKVDDLYSRDAKDKVIKNVSSLSMLQDITSVDSGIGCSSIVEKYYSIES